MLVHYFKDLKNAPTSTSSAIASNVQEKFQKESMKKKISKDTQAKKYNGGGIS